MLFGPAPLGGKMSIVGPPYAEVARIPTHVPSASSTTVPGWMRFPTLHQGLGLLRLPPECWRTSTCNLAPRRFRDDATPAQSR